MESEKTVGKNSAESYVALSNYFHKTKLSCFASCVVDFQTADLGAMEKECAKTWIKKHLTIYKDMKQKMDASQ